MAVTKEKGQHQYNGNGAQKQTNNNGSGYTPSSQVNAAQQQMWNTQAQKPGEYTQGAQATAAQNKLTAAENNQPGAYQQGDAVTNAQNMLAKLQANKPQGYTSKYSAQLDNILNQIQNPQEFKYSFNGDELFKMYADMYTQNGKQASMDAMGQAAALTGGYGNSYAQQVGNQAYDEWLRGLYDKGMELRDRAYEQYKDKKADLYNQYGLLQSADESAYGRYRDTVGDWYNDQDFWANQYNTEADRDYNRYRDKVTDWKDIRDYLAGRYDTERDVDYNRYKDIIANWQADQEYWTNLYKDLSSQDQDLWKTNLDEAYRRDTLAEDIRKNDLDEAYRRDTLAEDIRNNNLNEAYRRDTLAEDIRNNNLNEAYRRDTLAEDIRNNNLNEAYRRDTLAEDIRNNNLNEAYRRDTLAEDIRSKNLDEAYRRDQLAWDQAVDQRDFEEKVREFERQMDWENMSNDQKYASELALQMLSMGTMPSEGILKAAEIPFVDAQILMNSYQQMMAGAGGAGGNPGGKKSEYYYDDRGNVYTKDENGNAVWVPDDQVDKNGTFIKEDGVEGTKAKIVSQLEEGDKAPKNAGSPSDFIVGNTTKKTTKTPTLTDEQKNAIKKKGK